MPVIIADRPRHHSRRHSGDPLRGVQLPSPSPSTRTSCFATEHALSLTRPEAAAGWQSLIQTRNPQMEQLLIQASSIATMECRADPGPLRRRQGVMTQALHQASHRRDKPLHAINCAALPWARWTASCSARMASPACLPEAGGRPLPRRDGGSVGSRCRPSCSRCWRSMVRHPEVRVIAPAIRIWWPPWKGALSGDLFYRLNVANITLPSRRPQRGTSLLARQALDDYRNRHSDCAALGFRRRRWPCWRRRPGRATCASSAGGGAARSLCCSPVIRAAMVESALSGGGGGIPSFNEARAEFGRSTLIRLLRTTEGQ